MLKLITQGTNYIFKKVLNKQILGYQKFEFTLSSYGDIAKNFKFQRFFGVWRPTLKW